MSSPAQESPVPTQPCSPGSPDHHTATNAVEMLGQAIDALPVDGDPTPVYQKLRALVETRCFAAANVLWAASPADSARAIKTFWRNGGRAWIEFPLKITQVQRVVTAPTMRKTLRGNHPLACAPTDTQCGQKTHRWRQHAKSKLVKAAQRRHLALANDEAQVAPTESLCAQKGQMAESQERFAAWLDCIRKVPVARRALMLGNTRTPDRGWLLIRGRRGHYSFCDEIRAYDLATGSAAISRSCGGLVLRPNGTVDGARTAARQRIVAEQGRIPVDILREAAWMILMSSETQSQVSESRGIQGADRNQSRNPHGPSLWSIRFWKREF